MIYLEEWIGHEENCSLLFSSVFTMFLEHVISFISLSPAQVRNLKLLPDVRSDPLLQLCLIPNHLFCPSGKSSNSCLSDDSMISLAPHSTLAFVKKQMVDSKFCGEVRLLFTCSSWNKAPVAKRNSRHKALIIIFFASILKVMC